jgi:putative ABC transport system ATP-binding protein
VRHRRNEGAGAGALDERWGPWWLHVTVIIGVIYLRPAIMPTGTVPSRAIVATALTISVAVFIAVTAVYRSRAGEHRRPAGGCPDPQDAGCPHRREPPRFVPSTAMEPNPVHRHPLEFPPPSGRSAPAVELRGITRIYGRGKTVVHALRGVDVAFPSRSFTVVMGASGSGRSTLLQCAAGLDAPTAGSVHVGGIEITRLNENRLAELRRGKVGFVFQSFNLLPSLTVLDNVRLPLRLAGQHRDRRRGPAVLSQVGLAGYERRRPSQLSGGQQQRVAIARALVTEPEVIFADEPTGALDTTTAREILGLLRHAVDRLGATVVMVTHDAVAASFADRVLFLADGTIAGHLDRPDAAAVARRLGDPPRDVRAGVAA